LHHADDMDAKLAQVSTLFPDSDRDEPAWAPYQRSLDRPIYQAPRTPNTQPTKRTSKEPSDSTKKQEHQRLDQCSLL
ncbi:MAG: DNA-binding protein, partial [Bilophila wadsworthia]|nr:DNA-binding protein [Bilophila wadsworthia]